MSINIIEWQPTCTINAVKERGLLLRTIREFFYTRNVLEVETPLLGAQAITDPFLVPIKAYLQKYNSLAPSYLQTSPEFAMKRMLAEYKCSMYQICKAFRDEEHGSYHNPEFTMLEWYKVGFDDKQLMQEVDELLQAVLHTNPAIKVSYKDIFLKHCKINPHNTNIEELMSIANKHDVFISQDTIASLDLDDWLNILFSHIIQPELKGTLPFIVYNFPASQAAMAKKGHSEADSCSYSEIVAKRFEVYHQGIELGNGYYELQDAAEQLERLKQDNIIRKKLAKEIMPIDEKLVAALKYGLPDCAGIAIGIDRLLMAKMGVQDMKEVIAFPIDIS